MSDAAQDESAPFVALLPAHMGSLCPAFQRASNRGLQASSKSQVRGPVEVLQKGWFAEPLRPYKGACSLWGVPCPQRRSHVASLPLRPTRNADSGGEGGLDGRFPRGPVSHPR